MNELVKEIGSVSLWTIQNVNARNSVLRVQSLRKRKWNLLSMVLVGGFLLVRDARSAQIDDLNTAIAAEGNAVAESTNTEAKAFRLLDETDATSSALLIAPIVQTTVGGKVDIPLMLVPGPVASSALQFTISLPSNLSVTSVTTGPSANIAGKSVSFSSSTKTALIFGLNQNTMVEGIVAIVHLSVLSTASKGLYSFGMINPVATDASGKPIPLSLTSGTVEVQ